MKNLKVTTYFFYNLLLFLFLSLVVVCTCTDAAAQTNVVRLSKVLLLTREKQGAADLPFDHGPAGTWQRLLKLSTTASVLHTQAHPDDEQADLLTFLSRGMGARTALLSLNRGEGGGNILGKELFDDLGLLRTNEFLLAASYYGLDDLYFTKLVDYGFSKRVEEAYEKWGKEAALSEMVRVIRINRPLVIISRFHGSQRDGHGNHQAAGELSQQAWKLAADTNAFPDQIKKERLRPWKALKFYRGGIKDNEHWSVRLNTGVYSPWLAQTYKNFSLLGYSFHRSQFGGQVNKVDGTYYQQYERLNLENNDRGKEQSFFEGVDTSITGIFSLTKEKVPAGMPALLNDIAALVTKALSDFKSAQPSLIVPHLTAGLHKTREALQLITDQHESQFLLLLKEQQFIDAINTAIGIELTATAVPAGTGDRKYYEPLPTMGFAIANQPFTARTVLTHQHLSPITLQSIRLLAPGDWQINAGKAMLSTLQPNEKAGLDFNVLIPMDAPYSKPYFSRKSLSENLYVQDEPTAVHLPWAAPGLVARAEYFLNGEMLRVQSPVQVTQSDLPYGYNRYALQVAPGLGVQVQPVNGILPVTKSKQTITIAVEVVNNFEHGTNGVLKLQVPAGWQLQQPEPTFSFNKAGEKLQFLVRLLVPAVSEKNYSVQVTAVANGQSFTDGYEVISHRDLDQVVVYHKAIAVWSGVNVNIKKGVRAGYIMGAGDELPLYIKQLGVNVSLLSAADLAAGDLGAYDVILVGTRAYAVRQDLHTYNQRLLDYTKNGGHLLVLYQTPEFIPGSMAPFPGTLPPGSEEISEEHSKVELVMPLHAVLQYPNKISASDFEGWIEQRGSKFWSAWDKAYIPVISTADKGQSPQAGGWLMASYGKGYYTYCAYAFHRQLPYAVPGAYRLMANLLSYGKRR